MQNPDVVSMDQGLRKIAIRQAVIGILEEEMNPGIVDDILHGQNEETAHSITNFEDFKEKFIRTTKDTIYQAMLFNTDSNFEYEEVCELFQPDHFIDRLLEKTLSKNKDEIEEKIRNYTLQADSEAENSEVEEDCTNSECFEVLRPRSSSISISKTTSKESYWQDKVKKYTKDDIKISYHL